MPKSNQPKEGETIIVNEILSKSQPLKILDVGSGEGKWGDLLNQQKLIQIDGVEVWKENIDKYKLVEKYYKVFHTNIIDFENINDYDIVILGDVLEHLERKEAVNLLKRIKSTIYLTIPISKCVQDGMYYGNPYETHLYQWDHLELWELGFRAIHIGLNDNGKVVVGTYRRDEQ